MKTSSDTAGCNLLMSKEVIALQEQGSLPGDKFCPFFHNGREDHILWAFPWSPDVALARKVIFDWDGQVRDLSASGMPVLAELLPWKKREGGFGGVSLWKTLCSGEKNSLKMSTTVRISGQYRNMQPHWYLKPAKSIYCLFLRTSGVNSVIVQIWELNLILLKNGYWVSNFL